MGLKNLLASIETWIAPLRRQGEPTPVHMTFGQHSVGRNLSRTRLLLKKQLWVWPLVAIVLLSLLGYTIGRSIRGTMEHTLHSQLETLLSVERAMLEKWFKIQEANALVLANDPSLRPLMNRLLQVARFSETDEPLNKGDANEAGELALQLKGALDARLAAHGFAGFVVVDRQQQVVAAKTEQLVGQVISQFEPFLAPALDGQTTVSAPFPSLVMLKDSAGKLRAGTPTMFVCAPVRDENLQVVAVLALRIEPEKEFTRILQLGRIGETGETYAVDKSGVMVSNSRFDESLILLGLIPDNESTASILEVQVRDPGGNMQEGFRPRVRRRELPLTRSCAAVVAGSDGVDVQGYRDYRGIRTVGAWTWLPEYGIGLITEMQAAEAYRPLTILRYSFYALHALLTASAVAIFAFTVVVARLQRKARLATLEARQLGQYRLLEKIGAGAMGVVYKGQHAMLRRPTAIKLLDVERVDEASIQRFEREVQITCKLNNPHTIAIYDYGRTPEGVFYYAMEFLDGINLQTLVEQYGPQPAGRVAKILGQVCASLYEAHTQGLVHRDIKPANIMLNRRGGEADVVKVLDFGLVKALHEGRGGSSNQEISGTPLYMSPEGIQTPDAIDARSDLYAVGAVGYYLLTGQTPFTAKSLNELCQQHLAAVPEIPSQRLGQPVSARLEHAILACLEKDRARRPQTARDLQAMLDRVEERWTVEDADGWWSRRDRGLHAGAPPVASESVPTAADHGATQANRSQATVVADVPTGADGFDRTTVFETPGEEPT